MKDIIWINYDGKGKIMNRNNVEKINFVTTKNQVIFVMKNGEENIISRKNCLQCLEVLKWWEDVGVSVPVNYEN